MQEHRIRLNDYDLELIVASLRARAAMTRGVRRHHLERLAERLADPGRGNPQLRFSAASQANHRPPAGA